MKQLLIGSLITAFLMGSAPVMADDDDRRGHGWQKHHEWDHKYHDRHRYHADKRHWGKKHKRDVYRDRYERQRDWHRHHSGHYRIKLGYGDGLPPEARIGRIIHDTHVLIESSRR